MSKGMSISDRLLTWLFSDISLGLILPCIFGALIIAFPTVLADFLETIDIYFPSWLWGGPEIPLEHILTWGVTQGMLTCAIPVFLGITWNRWAGGASGFLLSVLYTLASAAFFGEWFVPTADWLGLIVSGMLAGYIAGSLMLRSRMRGSTGFKSMLFASIVAATVATLFTTETYIWYSPMFETGFNEMTYWDLVGYNYFIEIAIYFVWGPIGAIVAKVASWFR